MKYYYKDLESPSGDWLGLSLIVEETTKPNFHLQVYNKSKIKLVNQNKTVFWARIDKEYYDVLALKNYEKWYYDEMPIPPINSHEVEIRKNLSTQEYFKDWGKFFINNLIKSESSFLYKGQWILSNYLSNGKNWDYKIYKKIPKFLNVGIYNVKEAISREQLDLIDWYCEIDIYGLIGIKEKPSEDDGRVKWWRKKAREGTLPPIFALYLGCLEAHIIIDGHSRLMASVLENIPPKIILISSLIKEDNTVSPDTREKVLKSLEHLEESEENYNKMTIGAIDKRNNLLINVFDKEPHLYPKTFGYVTRDSEANWNKEVIDELTNLNLFDEIKYILNS